MTISRLRPVAGGATTGLALALAGQLLLAAVAKWRAPGLSGRSPLLRRVDARVLAGVDLAVGAGLLLPGLRGPAAAVLLGMTAASTVAVLRDPTRSCGCFGRSGGTAPWREHAARGVTAVEAAALLVATVIGAGSGTGPGSGAGSAAGAGVTVAWWVAGAVGTAALVALQPQLLPWRPMDRLGLPEALRAIRQAAHPAGLEPPLRTARPRRMDLDGDRWVALFDATLDGRPVTVEAEVARGPATLRITPPA